MLPNHVFSKLPEGPGFTAVDLVSIRSAVIVAYFLQPVQVVKFLKGTIAFLRMDHTLYKL